MIKTHRPLSIRFANNGKMAIEMHRTLAPDAKKAVDHFRHKIINNEIELISRRSCPFCDHQYGYFIAEKDCIGIPCHTVICKGCGMVFNDSYLDRENAAEFYKKYHGLIQWKGEPEKNFIRRTLPDAYAWSRFAFVSLSLDEAFRDLATVFEIGCGDGYNLFPYYVAGKDVLGCDLDDDFLAPGRMRGLDLRLGDIEALRSTGRKADLVVISHVFEHFVDLDKEIESVKETIKPSGYVYVEVPGLLNWNRCRSHQLKEDGYASSNNFLTYLQFQHNHHFDLHHLLAFWTRHGFKLVKGGE